MAEMRVAIIGVGAMGCLFGARLAPHVHAATALAQLRLELEHELVDDRLHHLGRQRAERDDAVEAVAELRGEEALNRLLAARLRVLLVVAGEADGRNGEKEGEGREQGEGGAGEVGSGHGGGGA